MDFSFNDEQQTVADLAATITAASTKEERWRDLSGGWLDRELYRELANANLLGLSLPESAGGSGFGLVESCLILEQAGRNLARVPFLEGVVGAAVPIAAHGTSEQVERLLPGLVRGESVLTSALGSGDPADVRHVSVRAARDADGWRLRGEAPFVAYADVADRVLLPAVDDADHVGLFLLDPAGDGVRHEEQTATTGQPLSLLTLEDASVASADVLLSPTDHGREVLGSIWERAVVGLCALQLGVVSRALEMTAEYTSQREQFGRPLAQFQAVAMRLADGYIDVEGIRTTLWQAAWRLDAGLPASKATSVAKFWAAEAGQRIVSAAQHLHGGMGADVDYPLHQYTLWSKHCELALGSASWHLGALGAELRDHGTQEASA